MADKRPHKKACHRCGGDMTVGQLSRQRFEEKCAEQDMVELETTYAHLRAVVGNCGKPRKGSRLAAIRHQLVGLLPEVRTYDPAEAEEMRAKGLGDLVDRRNDLAREGWAEYGYGGDDA